MYASSQVTCYMASAIMHADGRRMEELKQQHPEFFMEARNLLLGFCADGVSPFDKTRSGEKSLSMMCIVFQVFNLPPQVRQKYEHLMIWGISEGCKPVSHLVMDILASELLSLWNEGVRVWDAFKNNYLQLKVMMLEFSHDYPGYGEVARQMGVGAKAGCYKCTLEGMHSRPLGSRMYAHRLQYSEVEARTHQSILREAKRVEVRLLRNACPLLRSCATLSILMYIHAYMHIHTCLHTYLQVVMCVYVPTCMHTYIHTCIHSYMLACIYPLLRLYVFHALHTDCEQDGTAFHVYEDEVYGWSPWSLPLHQAPVF